MSHVFISYDHVDGEFAGELTSRIHGAGLAVWKDSASLHAGDDWRARIDAAIKAAFALIVVITPHATASEYVSYEWACGLGAGVKVIPLLVHPAELHPRLAAMHYLDFTNRERAPWEILIQELLAMEARAKPPIVKSAVDALDSLNQEEQARAIKVLADVDHPAARNALADAVHHHSRDVRIKAALQLARFKDARAVPGLIEAQRCWQLRWEFVRGITPIGSAAVPGLIQALSDDDAELREYAAHALGEIGQKSAVPALAKLANDRVANVRAAAIKAMETIAAATAGGGS